MPETPTPLYRLVDKLLDEKGLGPLADYVSSRRDDGATWRAISLDLRDDIGETITEQTFATWFAYDQA